MQQLINGEERRSGFDRRKTPDRREDIRFEPSKPPRRKLPYGRRQGELTAWQQSSV